MDIKYVGLDLDGSTCSESLSERTCHLEPPEHVPRTSARAQRCERGPGGLPMFHGAASTRKDARPEEKKMPKGKKNAFLYMYIYTYLVALHTTYTHSYIYSAWYVRADTSL